MEILFDRDGILAVEKPSGIPVIPERKPGRVILSMLEDLLGMKLFVVHRLDKETSGVLLFAKNARAHAYLSNLFEHRNVKKQYVAVVRGGIEAERGSIDAPLRQFGSGRMGVDAERGKPSRTAWILRRRLSGFTLLDVFPETGRRHQIRVHLYGIGHPVAGDPLYGTAGQAGDAPRLMLHALEVAFTGPGGDPVTVTSPLPVEFEDFIAVRSQ